MPKTSDSPDPELMTTDEVSTMLRTPVKTLHDWTYRRVGPPSVKVGTRRLYARADVLSWLAAQRQSA